MVCGDFSLHSWPAPAEQGWMLQSRERQELERQAQDLDTQMRELKKAASQQQQQGAAIKRSVTSEQAAVDALIMRRADLLSAAAMEQVGLRGRSPKLPFRSR